MQVKLEDVPKELFGSSTEIVDAAPRHWVSMCDVLEDVLSKWAAMEKHYAENVKVLFPLSPMEASIEELYSLIKPVAVLIKNTQKAGVPTGLSSFLSLVALRTGMLQHEKALTVHSPKRHDMYADGTLRDATDACRRVSRAAADLTPVAVETRRLLRVGIDDRFFGKRYDASVGCNPPPDYVFEMAASMHPYCARLHFLHVLCSSREEAGRVKAVIRRMVVDMMTDMAEGLAASGHSAEHPVGHTKKSGGNSDSPTHKRKRVRPSTIDAAAEARAEAQELQDSGMFGKASDGEETDDEEQETLRNV